MTMNGAVLPVMACYIVAGEEQGVALGELSGTIQNDILKEFMVRNTYIYPPAPSMRIVGDIIAYPRQRDADSSTRSRSAVTICRGGRRPPTSSWPTRSPTASSMSRLAQRTASTLDEFRAAPRSSSGIGMNIFMEVAKLRAARRLWARSDRALRGVQKLDCAAHPLPDVGLVSLTEQDPFNNVTRTCWRRWRPSRRHAVAAHQRLDEAIALPTDVSRASHATPS